MPHRVADFFRANDNLNSIKATVQRRRSPPAQRRGSREGVIGNYSYSSSSEEVNGNASQTHNNNQQQESSSQDASAIMPHATAPLIRMPELPRKDASKKDKSEKHHHRLSLTKNFHFGSSKKLLEAPQNPYASLDWKMESPPVVMHGTSEESTGALVSGQLLLDIKQIPVEIDSFEASLDIHVTQKRPFTNHCQPCAQQKTNLKKWTFLSEPTMLNRRTFAFPFSVLLEGHLPATTDSSLISIRYEFTASALGKIVSPVQNPMQIQPQPQPQPLKMKLSRNIEVRRALNVPELPHHSVRIFPPTNIAASVHYPQVIHPIGANKLTLRLDGIVKHNVDVKSVEYWKLKRLNWKLEEILKTVAPACDKHSPKSESDSDNDDETAAVAAAKKGTPRTAERVVGSGDMFRGWKADYSPGGTVEAELEFQCDATSSASSSSASSNARPPACDLRCRDGTEITHQLVVEMVVVHEYAPVASPRHITPTGVARVLRMHFGVVVTERGGLGVSWDNEAPPIYQDVPPSPPGYWCEVPPDDVDDAMVLDAAADSPPLSPSAMGMPGHRASTGGRLLGSLVEDEEFDMQRPSRASF